MTLFKGTGICQFNVDVEVIAKDAEEAEEKISELIETSFDDEIGVDGKGLTQLVLTYDECFEILDVMEVKKNEMDK